MIRPFWPSMEPKHERSLILRPSHEVTVRQTSPGRILDDMVASSLAMAREVALARDSSLGSDPTIGDPTILADLVDIGGFHLEAMTRQTGTREGEFVAWSRIMLQEQELGEWMNPHLQQIHAQVSKVFLDAAEQGDAWAQFFVGLGCRYGEGVRQDHLEAVKWFRQAAEQGCVQGQYELACCYRDGRGVAQDKLEAYRWFLLAAVQGDEKAKEQAGAIAKLMTLSEFESAHALYRTSRQSRHPA